MPIPFNKISSLEVSIETEALAEGGQNGYVHSLSKPSETEKTLIMERGADSGLAGSALTGAASMALRTGSIFELIIICVLDNWGLPKKLYAVRHAVLKKRRFSDLDAMSGEVFFESLEFAYRELTEVPGVAAMFAGLEEVKARLPEPRVDKPPIRMYPMPIRLPKPFLSPKMEEHPDFVPVLEPPPPKMKTHPGFEGAKPKE
jgi:phage tail-like protein